MKINLRDGRYVNISIQINEAGTYEYFMDNILVGVYDAKVMGNNKFLGIDLEKNNTISNELSAESKDEIKQIIEDVADQINQIGIEKIEEEAEENRAIDEYLKNRGINREKVKTTCIDIEKETIEKNTDKADAQKEKQEITTSDVNIKQEINLGERATDVEDFRKWLGGNLPQDIKKIGVIYSDEMAQMKDEEGNVIDNPSTQLGLIVISKDNKVEPLKKYIPQLEQNHSSGNNPIRSQYQIHTDGTVEKDPVLSEYRIGRKIIQLDKDHGDDLEVNIGKYSPDGNELVTTRMRDQNTPFATSIETRRAAMGHYEGVYEARNSYDEAQSYEKEGYRPEELTVKEIDGEKDTGYAHNDNKVQEIDMARCIQKVLEEDEIASVYGKDDVKDVLMEKMKGPKVLSVEELIEETKKQMIESAQYERTPRER